MTMEMMERPSGYVGPNLDPSRVRFHRRELGRGVIAVMARPIPGNNSGIIFGRDAALVVDAGINGEVARQLQELVRRVTDRPLRYLVNTNYHGDHTFGNHAFPPDVEIIAHRLTAESMSDLAYEKKVRRRNLGGHVSVLDEVTCWRRPDRVFDGERLDLDLGGRRVELRHFGPGNTPGDTLVYVPDTRVAWSGNLLVNERLLPMLLEVGAARYAETLARCSEALDVETIVPGHGPLASRAAFAHAIGYLQALLEDVRAAAARGLAAEAAVDAVPIRREFRLPWWFPIRRARALMRQFQRLNVLFTYRKLQGALDGARAAAPGAARSV